MTKIIEGDLVLTKDFKIEEDLVVHGNIVCKNGRWNINAWDINARNIDARNIDARNIDALNIDAWNIDAWDINASNIDAWDINASNIDAWDINASNIDAWDINARNIDAMDIICVSRKKKSKNAKTIAYSIILDRFNRELKEVMPESEGKS